jgi:uncharacterized protein (TIGR02246 family)
MIRALMIASVATAALTCPVGQTAEPPTKASATVEEAELRTYLLEIIERFNRHEVRPATSPGFTPDADFVNVEGRWMRGADEIRRVHSAAAKEWLKDAHIKLIELEIRFLRPDVAIVHQLHEITGSRRPDGTSLPPHQQISTRVLIREGGGWVTTAFQNNIVVSP